MIDRIRGSWLAPRLVIAGSLALVGGMVVLYAIQQPESFGFDYGFYREVGHRWLAGGPYYWPYQLEGPYPFTTMVDNQYPPNALYLFVPAALLPAIVWWLVPAAVLGYAIWRWRPGPWALAAAALLLVYPKSYIAIIFGNTEIWMAAAVAGGLLWGWPAVLLVIKPYFLPFAMVGVRHRSFWVAVAVVAVVSLAQLPLWIDYVAAVTNMQDKQIALQNYPLCFIPVVLWLGRSRLLDPEPVHADRRRGRAERTVPVDDDAHRVGLGHGPA